MLKTVYVGNLPPRATQTNLRLLFEPYASVLSVKLVKDCETGKPRGFGFIEIDCDDLTPILQALGGLEFSGSRLRVNEARSRGRRHFSEGIYL